MGATSSGCWGGGLSVETIGVLSTSNGHMYLSGLSLLSKLQSYSLLSSSEHNISYDSYKSLMWQFLIHLASYFLSFLSKWRLMRQNHVRTFKRSRRRCFPMTSSWSSFITSKTLFSYATRTSSEEHPLSIPSLP